ncbi:DMT family transporter [Ureibacillus acetophenoni]|uniref:Drug/metabolite transporter (DMT)-like permease n=1 Tax=Ureibacillus acetophenoni TaxID=614649 RepID=A0A285UKK5_9BACL|nr:DMT family transporter [Ureibacillus acetophenoni]SOC40771.1 drug/metabolite transporter (DMT)-like permease [Ureibacillus acetophenoni]
MRKYIGEAMLIITAIIWGSGFVFSAVSLDYFTPYQILALRFTIGVLILSAVFYKRLKKIKKSTLKRGLLLGIFLYLAFLLQTIGLQYTTPSKNAFLTAVNVVIVPFIAFFAYRRKIDKFELTGAFLAIIGIAFLSLQFTTEVNIGDLLTLACAFAFAYQIFYTAKFVKDEDPILLTVIQMGVAAVLGWIAVILNGEMSFSFETEGILSVLYLGIFSTTLAYCFQTIAQKYTSETKAAIILSTEAFWGMVFSIILLSEIITTRMIIGAILILIAILISETKLSFFKKKDLLENNFQNK